MFSLRRLARVVLPAPAGPSIATIRPTLPIALPFLMLVMISVIEG